MSEGKMKIIKKISPQTQSIILNLSAWTGILGSIWVLGTILEYYLFHRIGDPNGVNPLVFWAFIMCVSFLTSIWSWEAAKSIDVEDKEEKDNE